MEVGPGVALRGRYRLVERIGRGGFGEVFRARDEDLDRAVAVKMLTRPDPEAGDTHEFLARFEREARVMAGLRHPSIVTVHDRGVHEGTAFVVMELLAGPDLGTLQRVRVVLRGEEVAAYGLQAASAVEYLHAQAERVVHRDLKPSNLVLDRQSGAGGWADDAVGAVKLCDFGIAAVLGADLTRLTRGRQLMGTPVYAAPEQCRGEDATPAWDVFSLGTTLYSLLAGGSSFAAGDDWREVLRRVQFERPAALAKVRGDVPARLASLIGAMMDKDPGGRPDAAAVRRELAVVRDELGPAPSRTEAGLAETRTPTFAGPDAVALAQERSQAAERLLSLGRYADADREFAEVVKSLAAAGAPAGPGADRVALAAEFGRVRAGYARGDGVAVAIRLVRLLERAEARFGASDEFVRALRRFRQERS